METIYEAAGGTDGLIALAHAWTARCLADEVAAHPFENNLKPDHAERLAAYWAEALGGPAGAYTQHYGDESQVVALHSGNGEHDELNEICIALFDQALDDVGIGSATVLGQALHDYFAYTTTGPMYAFHHSADEVPAGLELTLWSWDGRESSQ